jgi:hypothetical protein
MRLTKKIEKKIFFLFFYLINHQKMISINYTPIHIDKDTIQISTDLEPTYTDPTYQEMNKMLINSKSNTHRLITIQRISATDPHKETHITNYLVLPNEDIKDKICEVISDTIDQEIEDTGADDKYLKSFEDDLKEIQKELKDNIFFSSKSKYFNYSSKITYHGYGILFFQEDYTSFDFHSYITIHDLGANGKIPAKLDIFEH